MRLAKVCMSLKMRHERWKMLSVQLSTVSEVYIQMNAGLHLESWAPAQILQVSIAAHS
jgi:hypothetical protein